MASARRISGSASASRFVALQERRQIVEVDGDVRVIGAEACLVDGERAPHQGLGLAMLCTSYEIEGQLVQ